MLLHEIKIIDMRNSEWDKKSSNPKAGKYSFLKKVYVDYQGGTGVRPEYHFQWVPKDKRSQMSYRHMGYVPVEHEIDPYYPEYMTPDGEGHYIFADDVILMKCPLMNFLLRKEKDEEIARKQSGRSRLMGIKEEINRTGLGLSDREVEDAIKRFNP